MNEREKQMGAALKAVVKAAGGEVRVSAQDMAADTGIVAMFPAGDDEDELLIKRYDCAEDATAAVEAARLRIAGDMA